MNRRFYVYALIDPRDGEPFYIGKGCGSRLRHHAAMVRSGKRDLNVAKCERILEIITAGLEVQEKKLRDQLTERQALRIEARLILRRRDTLTNINGRGYPTAGDGGPSPQVIARRREADIDWLSNMVIHCTNLIMFTPFVITEGFSLYYMALLDLLDKMTSDQPEPEPIPWLAAELAELSKVEVFESG